MPSDNKSILQSANLPEEPEIAELFAMAKSKVISLY